MKNRIKKKKKLMIKLIVLFFFLIASLLVADSQIRPIIKNLAEYKSNKIALSSINRSIIKTIETNDITYQSMIKISKDEQGRVTSIESDILSINMIKAKIADSILEDISNYTSEELNIPIGSLTGIQILSGRGPSMNFKIIPGSEVTTKMYSKFISAGVNQVLHQIMLKINVDVIALIPGYNTKTSVENEFCVAETVIVGTVPNSFFQIEREN